MSSSARPALDFEIRKLDRRFESIAQPVVQRLVGHFAWKTILLFVGVLAGLAASATLAVTGVLSYWVAIPLNAVLIYFIFTPLHEAVHRNISGRHAPLRWLEIVIGHVSGFVLLAPYPGFERLHLHHHQHTNDPVEDPDYWVKTDKPWMVLLRAMAIQPAYIWHLHRLATDPAGRRAFREEMIYLAIYGIILASAFQTGIASELLLLWVLPGYIGVVLCPLFFDWPVHHPHEKQGRYVDSAILLFPKPIKLIADLAFCGHTYHLMHHLYPRVPFYDYGTAYYALANELPNVGPPIHHLGEGLTKVARE